MPRSVWIVLLLIGACATAYLVANGARSGTDGDDDPIRDDVAAALAIPPERIPREDNLFFGLIGAASIGSDTLAERGERLWAGFEAAGSKSCRTLYGPGERLEFSGDAKWLCGFGEGLRTASCISEIQASPAESRALIAANADWIPRYRELRDFPAFHDVRHAEGGVKLPWYMLVDGRQLWMAQLLTDPQDAGADPLVADWLADIAFWRRLLQQTETSLYEKQRAAIGVMQDLALAGSLLREVPLDARHLVSLETGSQPFEAGTLALSATLPALLRQESVGILAARSQGINEMFQLQQRWPEPTSRWARERLYRPNATLNATYDALRAANGKRAGNPCGPVDSASQADEDGAGRIGRGLATWRNPLGALLASYAPPDFDPHYDRLCDLEGLRRLVVLHIRARRAGTSPAQMPAFLASQPADLHDPYTGQPMRWDAAAGGIRFAARNPIAKGLLPWKL